jgi:hypothetical protein
LAEAVEYVGEYAHPGEGWEIPIVFISGIMSAAVVEHILNLAFGLTGHGHHHGIPDDVLEKENQEKTPQATVEMAEVKSSDALDAKKLEAGSDSADAKLEDIDEKETGQESSTTSSSFLRRFFTNIRMDATLPMSTGYVILIGDLIHSEFWMPPVRMSSSHKCTH